MVWVTLARRHEYGYILWLIVCLWLRLTTAPEIYLTEQAAKNNEAYKHKPASIMRKPIVNWMVDSVAHQGAYRGKPGSELKVKFMLLATWHREGTHVQERAGWPSSRTWRLQRRLPAQRHSPVRLPSRKPLLLRGRQLGHWLPTTKNHQSAFSMSKKLHMSSSV